MLNIKKIGASPQTFYLKKDGLSQIIPDNLYDRNGRKSRRGDAKWSTLLIRSSRGGGWGSSEGDDCKAVAGSTEIDFKKSAGWEIDIVSIPGKGVTGGEKLDQRNHAAANCRANRAEARPCR